MEVFVSVHARLKLMEKFNLTLFTDMEKFLKRTLSDCRIIKREKDGVMIVSNLGDVTYQIVPKVDMFEILTVFPGRYRAKSGKDKSGKFRAFIEDKIEVTFARSPIRMGDKSS